MDKLRILNASSIKWLAVISMVIDHVGAIIFPEVTILRWIGRLAFPLFAYLLIEGYRHTSNLWRYILRLIILAVISEPIYDYYLHGGWFVISEQNIFFELILGLLVLNLLDRTYVVKGKDITLITQILVIAVGCGLAYLGNFSYKWVGILIIVIMFYIDQYYPFFAVAFFIVYLLGYGVVNAIFASLSLLLILMYNGKQGVSSKKLKWLFYLFYPVHLAIIGVINQFLL